MNFSIPSTMRAVQLDEPGGRLALREMPVPRPGKGQVLVRMAASPINPSDLSGLSGEGPTSYPFTPGREGSGMVVAAGEGVLPYLLNGRRVACGASGAGGTWAEYMVTRAALCMPLMRGVSLDQGAMLIVNPLSALGIWEVVERGEHRALVSTAAASALGAMLVRLGKRRGIAVINVVRRKEQASQLGAEGAQYVLPSSEAGFAAELGALAERLHATLLLDAVSGAMTGQLVEAAPYGSTMLLYARLSHEEAVFDARTAYRKHLRLQGWYLPNWLREKNPLQVLLLGLRAQSRLATDLRSPLRGRVRLEQAQAGLEQYRRQMSAGKILIVMDSG